MILDGNDATPTPFARAPHLTDAPRLRWESARARAHTRAHAHAHAHARRPPPTPEPAPDVAVAPAPDVAVAPAPDAAPEAAACKVPAVVWLDQAGEPGESWTALYKADRHAPRATSGDSDARAALCEGENGNAPACSAADPAYVERAGEFDVVAWLDVGGKPMRYLLSDLFEGGLHQKSKPLSERYIAISVALEHYGRSEGEDCDSDEGCPSYTYTAGFTYIDAVVDRTTQHLVLQVVQDQWDVEHICKDFGELSLEGDTFSVGTCRDEPIRFTLADAKPCTQRGARCPVARGERASRRDPRSAAARREGPKAHQGQAVRRGDRGLR